MVATEQSSPTAYRLLTLGSTPNISSAKPNECMVSIVKTYNRESHLFITIRSLKSCLSHLLFSVQSSRGILLCIIIGWQCLKQYLSGVIYGQCGGFSYAHFHVECPRYFSGNE